MKLRLLAVGAFLLAAAGCAEPLVFPDWSLPVDEGTRVVEYPYVPVDERDAAIGWIDELVIGDRGDTDVRYAFNRPSAVTVDARGQIYVVDPRAGSVKVFDENGEYLRELGRPGQGPGEFQDPRSVASVGDRVIVGASRNARWSHFDLDGNHIEDHAYPIFHNLELISALPTGDIVGSTWGMPEEIDHVVQGYGVYSSHAELQNSIVEISYVQVPTLQRGERRSYFGNMPQAYPQVAVGVDGNVYWSRSDEYQILALDPSGGQRWALRVAWTPPAVSRAEIDAIMAMVRESYEDVTEAEVKFPEREPAIAEMLVDGHGHLYVFHYAPRAGEAAPETVPVDVYGPDGERLFSGMSPRRTWAHADGDYVWEIGMDPATEEYVVRKVRLVEPFD